MSKLSRRKTLKGLALTVPAAWSAPLVQSIMLPAHAQTSPEDDTNERTDCNNRITVTASRSEIDGPWALGLFNVDQEPLDGDSVPEVSESNASLSLEISASNLADGAYIVSIGNDGESEASVQIETCEGGCEIMTTVSGGGENGFGNEIVRVSLPEGDCLLGP